MPVAGLGGGLECPMVLGLAVAGLAPWLRTVALTLLWDPFRRFSVVLAWQGPVAGVCHLPKRHLPTHRVSEGGDGGVLP